MTFASFLTPEGIIAAAALAMSLIQVIKAVFPGIDARVSGALMAFTVTAILYVLAGASVGVPDLNAGLTIFAAWLACATAAIGIKSAADHVSRVTAPPPDGTPGD